jgi:PIN domain nuclease of toxin-antitoxin system
MTSTRWVALKSSGSSKAKMKLLVDTHLLVWAAYNPKRLTKAARALIEDFENELVFSAASLWEITIKQSLGRQDFHVNGTLLRRDLLDNGYAELSITSEHALYTDQLTHTHKDPFDRILLAQVILEGITLVTNDRELAKYQGPIRKV